jgi:hypothetical protein
MPAEEPTQPPASDFSTMEKAWLDNLKRPDGQPYAVFGNRTLTRWKQWVGGESEFDGKGLRDTVDKNAQFLNAVDRHLHTHIDNDNTRHAALAARVTALEAAGSNPFPG